MSLCQACRFADIQQNVIVDLGQSEYVCKVYEKELA